MIEGYSHIGHVVRDINKGIDLYARVFGLTPRGGMTQIPGGKG